MQYIDFPKSGSAKVNVTLPKRFPGCLMSVAFLLAIQKIAEDEENGSTEGFVGLTCEACVNTSQKNYEIRESGSSQPRRSQQILSWVLG